jgi:hypothetical protein
VEIVSAAGLVFAPAQTLNRAAPIPTVAGMQQLPADFVPARNFAAAEQLARRPKTITERGTYA